MQGEFDCVYVQTPGTGLSKKDEAALSEAFDLARNLGGEVVELEGDSVSEEIIKYANKVGATVIVRPTISTS